MREIFKFIFKIITIIIYRPKIIGAENVPKEGNAIICANHVHFWDSVVIIVMLKRKVNVLAKEELFKPKFNKWFAGVIGAYPVKRGTADLGAVKTLYGCFSRRNKKWSSKRKESKKRISDDCSNFRIANNTNRCARNI